MTNPVRSEKVRGGHVHTMPFAGHDRRFTVHAPPDAGQNGPVPLVVMLHGGGGTARAAAYETGWNRKADRESFIVAYPEALPPDPARPGRFVGNPQLWNDGSNRFYAGNAGIDDTGFLAATLDVIMDRYPVDPRRIYLTGFSNGASMTFRAGAALSERVAAIAPVAGACWQDPPVMARPVPMCYVTGTEDPLNPIGGGVPKSLGASPKTVRRVAKPAPRVSVVKWAEACGLPRSPAIVTKTAGILVQTHLAAPGGPEVVYMEVAGLGHTWAGGKSLLPAFMVGKRSDRINATDVIWAFFKKHSLPEADDKDDLESVVTAPDQGCPDEASATERK